MKCLEIFVGFSWRNRSEDWAARNSCCPSEQRLPWFDKADSPRGDVNLSGLCGVWTLSLAPYLMCLYTRQFTWPLLDLRFPLLLFFYFFFMLITSRTWPLIVLSSFLLCLFYRRGRTVFLYTLRLMNGPCTLNRQRQITRRKGIRIFIDVIIMIFYVWGALQKWCENPKKVVRLESL